MPPPSPLVTTVIWSAPALVRSAVGMTAVNCVAPTNVVAMAVPLKSASRAEDEAAPG